VNIQTLPEFYAHSLAIEQEAAARYRELRDQMSVHHNEEAAKLFDWLAGIEDKHAQEIARRARDVALPEIAPWDYEWQGMESPESAPHDSAHYLMTPVQALEVALENERRAAEFYDRVARTSEDQAVRKLAEEFAAEERQHIGYVEDALAKQDDPTIGWDEDLDDPQAVE